MGEPMNPFQIVIITLGITIAVICIAAGVYSMGALDAQKTIKTTCEKYGVVELPMVGSMFYCSREPKK